MSTTNIVTVVDRLQKSIAGVKKHFPNGVTLGGASYTTAALEQLFTSYVSAATAAQAARASWRDAVGAAHDAKAKALPVHRQLLSYAATVFGKAQGTLADFGTAPPTRKTPTVEAKVVAKQKRQATRQARGTKGKVQKKSVKGSAGAPTPASPATPPNVTSPPPAKAT